LLDFFEEKLDLPTFFVYVGDGFRAQPEVVAQKFVVLAACRVTVADAAQTQGFPPTGEFDDVTVFV
jgi:hypothetical protein